VPSGVCGASARVGERLKVGDQQGLCTLALKSEPRAQRATVVPEMERAGGPVTRENDVGRVGVTPALFGT